MKSDTPEANQAAMEDAQKLAAIRKALGAELERRRALGEDIDGAGTEGERRAADPALCPRGACRRMGVCRPPRSGHCADDPDERMRRRIAERLRAIRDAMA